MKLRRFFEEHLRLRKGRGAEKSSAAAPPPQPGHAGGTRKSTPQAGHPGFPACRCPTCVLPNGLPRFHASAPASVGLRVDCRRGVETVVAASADRSGGGGLLGRGVDWIRPPPSIRVHAADDRGAVTAAETDAAADDGVTAVGSLRRTTVAEATLHSSDPEPPAPPPDQYNTVPRCRSRIKTNPWIPAPRSIACPDGGGGTCVWRRQSADTAATAAAAAFASGNSSALLAGDGLRRLLPGAAAGDCDDGSYSRVVRSPDNVGHFSGGGGGGGGGSESGYATCSWRHGCFGGDDEDEEAWRLSPRDDYYYDWHEALREAFTPVTRGDDDSPTSSADDVWSSVGLDSDCPRGSAAAADQLHVQGGDRRWMVVGHVTSPSLAAAVTLPQQCVAPSPSSPSLSSPVAEESTRSLPFGSTAACTSLNCRCGGSGSRDEHDDVAVAQGVQSGSNSRNCCRWLAEDGDCSHGRSCSGNGSRAIDDRMPPLPAAAAEDVGLAARVRKIRSYDSVLNEKIRLARIECQLILSSLAAGEYGGGADGSCIEEAR